ncbi:hypothetical protein [Haloglycomyces albus]|uniref:hypothetical protein n=1 Tax=Haloglycomyces albus TaxID=526067 RepID=UPI0004A24676|nr:hypothetical protein [Haloglycomyces albus]
MSRFDPTAAPRRALRWLRRNRDLSLAWGLVAVLAAFAAWQVLPRSIKEAPADQVDNVIVVGVAGLGWGDINADDTPELYDLAADASVAELRLNSGHRLTCAASGWLTLAAGNGAVSETLPEGECEPVELPDVSDTGASASIEGFSELYDLNRELDPDTRLGTMASASECATAIGPGAAYATANGVGRVAYYDRILPSNGEMRELLGQCPLSVIDGGEIAGAASLQAVDSMIGRVREARGPDTAVVVTGIGQTEDQNRLQALMIDQPHTSSGLLDVAGEKPGYMKLTDLTPTVIALLGSPQPDYLRGHVAATVDDSYDFSDRLAAFTASDARLAVADEAAARSQWLQALLLVAVAIVAFPLMRQLRRAGQPGVKPPRLWLMRADIVVALLCALFPTAAVISDAFDWWALPNPTVSGPLLAVAVASVLAAAASLLPRRHSPSTLLAVISLSGLLVTVLAMAVHYSIAMGTLMGDSGISNSTSQSIGPVVAGIYIASLWMFAAALAWNLPRRFHAPVMAGIGTIGVAGMASGMLGNSTGTAVALVVGTCLAAALAYGGWMSAMRLLWSLMVGGLVLVVLSWMDYRRPQVEQGALGEVVTDLLGESNGVIRNATGANLVAIFTSPLTMVALIAGVYCWLVLLRPGGGLRRAFGLHPPLRAAVTAAAVTALCAGVLTGKGFMVLGVSLAVIVPLAVIVSHRVLARAHVQDGEYSDMTVNAPSWVDGEPGTESVSVESRG